MQQMQQQKNETKTLRHLILEQGGQQSPHI